MCTPHRDICNAGGIDDSVQLLEAVRGAQLEVLRIGAKLAHHRNNLLSAPTEAIADDVRDLLLHQYGEHGWRFSHRTTPKT
jgi:hypothetical protein